MKKGKQKINSFDELPVVLTVDDVSTTTGLSRVKCYELVNSDRLAVIRVGRRILIPKSSFIRFLESEASKER